MIKRVLILCGGISKERLISLETGKQVAKELKKNSYRICISEPDNLLKNQNSTDNKSDNPMLSEDLEKLKISYMAKMKKYD